MRFSKYNNPAKKNARKRYGVKHSAQYVEERKTEKALYALQDLNKKRTNN